MAEEEEGQSSSSSSFCFSYDVFLSFRGTDTRRGFTGNLYKALYDNGIRTFMDDQNLDVGDEITPALVNAIRDSRIAIVVLSKNYASSSFCLDELSYIFDCIQLTVLPVFYDVEPSHPRHQLGSYGEALKKHEGRFKIKGNKDNMKKLENWKMSLNRVANLSGFSFNPNGNEYEHQLIWRIVKLVNSKISQCALHVANYLVGLESQVGRVNTLLEVGSTNKVLVVGIYGVGGIGKTTLARAVYNSIADKFEGICFLENVRENSSKHGLEHLQEILLYKIFGEKDIRLASVGEGISIMEHRFRQKKVLLILDDIDKGEQLQALVGGLDLFGYGSRVIITTRDKHMLVSHRVKRTHEVEGLNEKDALELLSWKAFKNAKVDPSYKSILTRSVVYASGLPLALELIGSNLSGKSIEEWESALDEYERVPPEEIQRILKVSYDALEGNVKKVFLDIACFFKGYKFSEVECILCAHYGHDVKYHIGVLIDRSMMRTTWSNRVTLHDLLEHMGKEIVRQESPEDPGQRSRLWFHEDIIQVLEQNEGTSKIQIIVLDFPKFEEEKDDDDVEVDWNGDAFKKMKNLKTLIIKKKVHISKGHKDRAVRFSGSPKHLPNSLRVLEWWGYPSQSLPSDFKTENLLIFKLTNSLLTLLGFPEMRKKFKNLRVLNFNGNECITHIPDVSSSPKLEELSFVDCRNLITIDKSVGLLDKLKILDATGCINLGSFPPIKLISLQHLRLSRCWSLETFPEILEKMENIKQFSLEYTPIKEFPFSIQNLTQLERLHLDQCGRVQLPSSFVKLTKLWQVSIYGINAEVKENGTISDEFFPELLTSLANVRRLDLSDHDFRRFPESITKCHSLRELNLGCCHYLREIRCIPPKLETLSVESCTSLEVLDLTVLPAGTCCLRKLTLDGCVNLQKIKGISPNIEDLSALRCESLTNSSRSMLLNQGLHEKAGNILLSLPGNVVPEWFEHYSMRQSIFFWFRGDKFPSISLCLAIGQEKDDTGIYFQPKLNVNGKTVNAQHESEQKFLSKSPLWLEADHIFIFDLKHIQFKDEVHLEKRWNHAEVCFDTYNYNLEPIQLPIRTGLHEFKSRSSTVGIRFISPYERDYDSDSNSMASTQISSTTNVKGQSTSTFNCAWTYDDVVLSFLGRDTRHGFTGNLYKALHDKGIHTTFMDDEELQSGEEINPSLLYAIRKSRIAIIVLSKNYASSSFCLDELSAILDLVKGNGRLVLPVFYEVDPSDVRHHRGTYGEALVKHEERFKAIEGTMKRLQKWKVALNQVGTLSGWHFKQHGNEYELKFIERIVEFVCSIILPYSSHVADYPDGFSSRVLEVNTLLELGSDGVQMVGIYGFIGIGKTTLARAIYSLIADQFEGTYFLENVRENSRKHGLVYLQETLFHKIVGEKDTRLAHVNEGISRIKHCLNQKKVLLILDDVDRLEQLQAIVGGRDWFGSGSRVIITTRNRELLACHGVERTYEVNGLNEREALELFTLHAFRDAKVDPSYDDILKRLVMYASSIPLTLKIIGSKLFGRNVEEWKYALEHYKINPPREIQQVLRLSFDDLDEDVREIFLDIACFFKGCRLEDVEDVLCAHHDFITKYALRVLVDSSLIKIRDDLVSLHDLVEQVGREIVRQESPKDPGKRSRLWFHEDIIEVLKDDEGSSKIQTIMLDFPDVRKAIAWNGKAFKKMNNLRTLIIRNGCSDVDVEHLPNSLRVLEWREYPSSSLPSDFHPEELTILKLSYSGLASLDFLKTHKFTSLRVLEFDGSERILEIYYVSGVPNLEKLSFRYCKNLFQIDESVGFLKKLRVLDADGCSKLRRFPPIMLTSLQHLNLSHCSSLERFPEILGVMENITELHLEGTPIRELPFSIQYLTQLEELYLKNCGLREIRWIPPKLETLSVVCCTSLKYLVLLNLCGTGSTCSLRTLILDGCKDLEKIRGIPPNIERLSALNCTSLTHSFRSMLLNQVSREAGSMVLTLPGSRIPEWFEHVSIAEPISFWFRDMFPAISLCAVITLEDDSSTPFHVHPKLNINGNAMNNYFISDHLLIEADHICIFDDIQSQFSENVNEVILENEWNYAEIWVHAAFVSDRSQLAIQTGLHVFKQKGSMEDIQFSNPYEIARDDERDSCSMVSTQISSSTNVKGLQEIHHLTSIIQQDFGGRESVNEGKGKGILACNSSSDGEKIYRSPSLELLPTTMEYEVTSEKDQHASNDESMTRDPEHQRSGQWQFSLWGLIFSVVSLCCSSFSLSAR